MNICSLLAIIHALRREGERLWASWGEEGGADKDSVWSLLFWSPGPLIKQNGLKVCFLTVLLGCDSSGPGLDSLIKTLWSREEGIEGVLCSWGDIAVLFTLLRSVGTPSALNLTLWLAAGLTRAEGNSVI